jgi:hypothetical protein
MPLSLEFFLLMLSDFIFKSYRHFKIALIILVKN